MTKKFIMLLLCMYSLNAYSEDTPDVEFRDMLFVINHSFTQGKVDGLNSIGFTSLKVEAEKYQGNGLSYLYGFGMKQQIMTQKREFNNSIVEYTPTTRFIDLNFRDLFNFEGFVGMKYLIPVTGSYNLGLGANIGIDTLDKSYAASSKSLFEKNFNMYVEATASIEAYGGRSALLFSVRNFPYTAISVGYRFNAW